MTNILIHARTHDNASVVSAEFEVELTNVQSLLDALSAQMERVNAWAEHAGAIIGHLKGSVAPCEGSYTLSTVGADVNVSGTIAYDVGVTGIVMIAKLADVQSQITELAKRALAGVGVDEIAVEVCNEEYGHHH